MTEKKKILSKLGKNMKKILRFLKKLEMQMQIEQVIFNKKNKYCVLFFTFIFMWHCHKHIVLSTLESCTERDITTRTRNFCLISNRKLTRTRCTSSRHFNH